MELGDNLEWRGETLHWHEWAAKIGIPISTMSRRMQRVRAGDRAYDTLFRPPLKKLTLDFQTTKKEIVEKYVRAFHKNCAHRFNAEMVRYLKTGEQGPAMKLFKENKEFLKEPPQVKTEEKSQAPIAIFFGGNTPMPDIKVIEGDK